MIDPDPKSYATLCYAVTDTSFTGQHETNVTTGVVVWSVSLPLPLSHIHMGEGDQRHDMRGSLVSLPPSPSLSHSYGREGDQHHDRRGSLVSLPQKTWVVTIV